MFFTGQDNADKENESSEFRGYKKTAVPWSLSDGKGSQLPQPILAAFGSFPVLQDGRTTSYFHTDISEEVSVCRTASHKGSLLNSGPKPSLPLAEGEETY